MWLLVCDRLGQWVGDIRACRNGKGLESIGDGAPALILSCAGEGRFDFAPFVDDDMDGDGLLFSAGVRTWGVFRAELGVSLRLWRKLPVGHGSPKRVVNIFKFKYYSSGGKVEWEEIMVSEEII